MRYKIHVFNVEGEQIRTYSNVTEKTAQKIIEHERLNSIVITASLKNRIPETIFYNVA